MFALLAKYRDILYPNTVYNQANMKALSIKMALHESFSVPPHQFFTVQDVTTWKFSTHLSNHKFLIEPCVVNLSQTDRASYYGIFI